MLRLLLLLLLSIGLVACVAGRLVDPQGGQMAPAAPSQDTRAVTPLPWTPTPEEVAETADLLVAAAVEEEATTTPTAAPVEESPTPNPTATPTQAATPAATSAVVVAGSEPCQRPPDDLSLVNFNGHTLNARTLWMLHLADEIYTGRGDPLRVTQGSYTEGEDLSFGTHSGGGAVDISIRVKSNPSEILSMEEAGELVLALRRAGFAAWLRLPQDLTPSVPLHIHAIAVGDPELSPAAYQQLVGPEGYFHGLDGVPPEYGGPRQDRYGGSILCDWMVEMGLRQ